MQRTDMTGVRCPLSPRCASQVGTGVMVGLPGQSLRDLAKDILFFRGIGADMIGERRRRPGTHAATSRWITSRAP